MAPFKFTKVILNSDPIDVYNQGDIRRDFTYIGDLVTGMGLSIDGIIDASNSLVDNSGVFDSKSFVAPYRILNIGNSKPTQLLDFVGAFEKSIGIKAVKNLMPMQAGDALATWADTSLLEKLTGYKPNTDLLTGVKKIVAC